jgi:hypothetical protein
LFILERKTWKIIKFAVIRMGSSKYQFIFPLSYAIPVTLGKRPAPREDLHRQFQLRGGKRKLAALFVGKIRADR